MERKLRKEYEITNETGPSNYNKIQLIKPEMNSLTKKIAAGVKVKSRIQGTLANESISKCLIAKQKEISKRKFIYKITNDNGIELTTFPNIEADVKEFYEKMNESRNLDMVMQDHFSHSYKMSFLMQTENYLVTLNQTQSYLR